MPEIIVKLGDRVVQKYLLYKNQKLSIGRAPDNDIAIENPAVSRRHATVEMVNGRYILEDNNSANGSYVNGVRVTKTEILDKDVITIGKHKLHFYNQDAAPASSAQPVLDESTMVVNDSGKSAPAAVLRVAGEKGKEQTYPLAKVETRIGRAADNDIRLHDWFVSKHHAVIGRKGAVHVLRDLDSWRHTMVNGQVVAEAVLKNGDEIQFGPKILMTFELIEGEAEVGGTRRPVELGEKPPETQGEQNAAELEGDMEGAVVHTESVEAVVEVEAEAAMPAESGQPEAPAEPVQAMPAEPVTPTAEAHPEVVEEGSARSRRRKKRRHHEEIAAAEAVSDSVAEAPAPEASFQAALEPEAAAPSAPVTETPAAAANGETDLGALSDAQREEVALWEKALGNPSNVIRKQAAKKLKQLTGRDYDV